MSIARPDSVILYASQLAAAIGYNRHKRPADALESMWERVAPGSFRAALARTGVVTEAGAVAGLVARDPRVRDLIAASSQACTDAGDVNARYERVSRALTALDLTDGAAVDAVLKKNLYTNYGTAAESVALDKMRETLGIEARPDPTFYKQQIGEVDGVPVWVGGKIDAITGDNIVIEVKNRIRQLFFHPPFHEKVQLQTYLQLMGHSRGAIVECLTVNGDSIINVVPVNRDRDLWNNTVVPKIRAFVRVFLRLLGDAAFQDAFLTAPHRVDMVNAATRAAAREPPASRANNI